MSSTMAGAALRRPLPAGADPVRSAVAETIAWARREQRISVRVLLERMDLPLSPPRYVRFESGLRALPEEIMRSVCRVLGLDLDPVVADAVARVAAGAEGKQLESDPASSPGLAAGAPINLGPGGPQVPAIRVRVAKMMVAEDTWLDPVRGMLGLHAARSTDPSGDLLLEEPLIRAIAQISGRSLFECWVGLSAFIEQDLAGPAMDLKEA